ncbi:hypothetical protein HK405_007813, partial [Cladochytrium tenue]
MPPSSSPISMLQEICMRRRLPTPEYRTVEQRGPTHAPIFRIAVLVNATLFECPVSAPTKQEAKALAATHALRMLGWLPPQAPTTASPTSSPAAATAQLAFSPAAQPQSAVPASPHGAPSMTPSAAGGAAVASSQSLSGQASSRDVSALFECCQKLALPAPEFEIAEKAGPSHAPIFRVRVRVFGNDFLSGFFHSVREAKAHASSLALNAPPAPNLRPAGVYSSNSNNSWSSPGLSVSGLSGINATVPITSSSSTFPSSSMNDTVSVNEAYQALYPNHPHALGVVTNLLEQELKEVKRRSKKDASSGLFVARLDWDGEKGTPSQPRPTLEEAENEAARILLVSLAQRGIIWIPPPPPPPPPPPEPQSDSDDWDEVELVPEGLREARAGVKRKSSPDPDPPEMAVFASQQLSMVATTEQNRGTPSSSTLLIAPAGPPHPPGGEVPTLHPPTRHLLAHLDASAAPSTSPRANAAPPPSSELAGLFLSPANPAAALSQLRQDHVQQARASLQAFAATNPSAGPQHLTFLNEFGMKHVPRLSGGRPLRFGFRDVPGPDGHFRTACLLGGRALAESGPHHSKKNSRQEAAMLAVARLSDLVADLAAGEDLFAQSDVAEASRPDYVETFLKRFAVAITPSAAVQKMTGSILKNLAEIVKEAAVSVNRISVAGSFGR